MCSRSIVHRSDINLYGINRFGKTVIFINDLEFKECMEIRRSTKSVLIT